MLGAPSGFAKPGRQTVFDARSCCTTVTNRGLLLTVELDGVAPPVPAAHRIVDAGDRLRVDDDNVVQLGSLVVASVASELVFQ